MAKAELVMYNIKPRKFPRTLNQKTKRKYENKVEKTENQSGRSNICLVGVQMREQKLA